MGAAAGMEVRWLHAEPVLMLYRNSGLLHAARPSHKPRSSPNRQENSDAVQGIPERFITGLADSKAIGSEIENFIHAIYEEGSKTEL